MGRAPPIHQRDNPSGAGAVGLSLPLQVLRNNGGARSRAYDRGASRLLPIVAPVFVSSPATDHRPFGPWSLTPDTILAFLEGSRKNVLRTCNSRLAAIRASTPYLIGLAEPGAFVTVHPLLTIPVKRSSVQTSPPCFA